VRPGVVGHPSCGQQRRVQREFVAVPIKTEGQGGRPATVGGRNWRAPSVIFVSAEPSRLIGRCHSRFLCDTFPRKRVPVSGRLLGTTSDSMIGMNQKSVAAVSRQS
jgi:hypothetical protein